MSIYDSKSGYFTRTCNGATPLASPGINKGLFAEVNCTDGKGDQVWVTRTDSTPLTFHGAAILASQCDNCNLM